MQEESNSDHIKKSQKTYEHTFPVQEVKNDYFSGEFIRNDIASIYPRRESLVKDILVDIGDSVRAWETLAILFEPWIEGQSASNIWFKSTIVNSQEKILSDSKKVKDAKIQEFDAQIKQKEVLLADTLINYDAKINAVWDDAADGWSQYSVWYQKLETLKSDLEKALVSQGQVLQDAQENITQKKDLFSIKVDEVYTSMIPMLYIGEELYIDYETLEKRDLHTLFSVKNTSVLQNLVSDVQKYQTNRAHQEIAKNYTDILNISKLLKSALEGTLTSVNEISQETIDSYIVELKTLELSLQSSRENYDDALNQLNIIKASQEEKISRIESNILEQKESLALIASNVTTLESEKKLQVEKLRSEIETLKKSKELLIANENKSISEAENSVAIARADLNKEYVASGDFKIISPFSGVISKRDIQIGEMMSPSMEAFRVSWVDNSLSRITKHEIKFFIPENLQGSFQLWQEVYFSLDDEAKTFTGSIYRISPEIDEETKMITLQAKVADTITFSNKSTIRVSLETESLSYKVPTSSIYNKDERTIMYYKKDNGKLWVKDIVIISDDGEFSIVTGDFDETLKIVTTPIFVK